MKIKLNLFRNLLSNILIGTMLVFMLSLTYAGGVLNVFASSYDEPYYNGDLKSANVSLMVNVYWGTEYILPMLDIFDEYDIKVTFFVGGLWASKESETLIEIFNRGHEIGNHGYYHKDHKNLSFEKNQEEIYVTHNLVKTLTGVEMNLFAPPSGSFSKTTLEVAKNLGYKTIMWSKDTIDWRDKDANLIYERAIKNAKGGDLILMHPTEATLQALSNIINFYLQKGFNLTSVSQNIYL